MRKERKATLRDGQDAGDVLLDIETRIGELLPSVEAMKKNKPQVVTQRDHLGRITEHESKKVLSEGIDKRKAHQSRAIAANPAIVAKVKAQARENEDIATKTAVLNAISYEKERARKDLMGVAKRYIWQQGCSLRFCLQHSSVIHRVIAFAPGQEGRGGES